MPSLDRFPMRALIAGALCSALLGAGLAEAGTRNHPLAGERIVIRPAASGNVTVTGRQIIAPDQSCSSVVIRITGDVTGQVDDGSGLDEVLFELWDDGTLKDSESVFVPVGQTQSVDVTLQFTGTYGTSAPGVGVYAYELGLVEDPFIPVDEVGACLSDSEIKGGVKGLRRPMRVVCENATTGQTVTLRTPFFNCTAAGLQSSPGDKVNITIRGVAK